MGHALVNGFDAELFRLAALQEGARFFFGFELAVERGVDGFLRPLRQEAAFHPEERFGVECGDFPFPVHDEPQRHRLHAAGGELGLDLLPQDGGEFEADQTVEDATGLLGLDQVHVDVAGIFDGLEDGVLRDFVEDDTAGLLLREAEGLAQMPGNGLSFTVFIGSQPYGVGFLRGGGQIGHRLFLVGRNFILREETMFDIDAQSCFLEVTDVAETGFYGITFAEKLLNRLGLGRRLHND